MQIAIADLRKLTETLLSHLEEQGKTVVEVPFDYYWDIPEVMRYDPTDEPSGYDLGQLTDNWLELSKLLSGSSEPVGYQLVWLAAVLRAVGETNVS